MPNVIDYSGLPAHMQDGMRLYIERGIPPGSFQRAVLSNDLLEAFRRADDVNSHAMRSYAVFLACQAPCGCLGSQDHVKEWIARGGMEGLTE